MEEESLVAQSSMGVGVGVLLSLPRAGKGGQVLDISEGIPANSFNQYILGIGDSGVGVQKGKSA